MTIRSKIRPSGQKVKWAYLQKESFLEDLLAAKPKDYAERNYVYYLVSNWLSYPLQLISILAGSYLLYDTMRLGQIKLDFFEQDWILAALGLAIFLGIESLRRWLVNTTGYNYLTTFRILGNRLQSGQWIRSNLFTLILISILLVTSGTLGVYRMVQNHAPKAEIKDLQVVLAPWDEKIKEMKEQIRSLNGNVSKIITQKQGELKDQRSYARWKGKDYLLPEVKERHIRYDQQVGIMQDQQQTYLSLAEQYEIRRTAEQEKIEKHNEIQQIESGQHKEHYASVTAGVWLLFELILSFFLAYPWIYLFYCKKELLLYPDPSLKTPETHKDQASYLNPQGTVVKKSELPRNAENPEPEFPEIGFTKWYQKKSVPNASRNNSIKSKSKLIGEGFYTRCAHCGKEEIKKRPAKYCSDQCRTRAWKARKSLEKQQV